MPFSPSHYILYSINLRFYHQSERFTQNNLHYLNFCDSVLARRFETLTQPQNKSTSALAAIVFLSISFFIYVSSYFIIFEANYFPPDMFTDDIIIPTEDNCFVIKCPDGQYDFYLYGEYIETLPDKEHCIIGITTYKNIQEARKHEKIISEK